MGDVSPSELKTTTGSPRQRSHEKPARLLPFLTILGILGILCIGPTLSRHGHLSYAYLRSLFFDGDLNIVNEAARCDVGWPAEVSLEPHRDTGLPSTPASGGPGLFWSPFLFGAHVFVLVLRWLGLPVLPDGYNQFYFLAINIGTFFYLALGCALTVVALQRFRDRRPSVALILAGALASPLLGGSMLDGSLPDALSFFGAGFFLFEWVEYRRYPRTRNALMLGTAAGILCLIRPVNIVLCLWPLIDMLRESAGSRRYPSLKCLWYVAALTAAITPQLLVWHVQHGQPWPAPQDRPQLDFHPGRHLLFLFAWPDGLFVSYPFFALGLLGLIHFTRKEPRLGGPLLLSFLAGILTAGVVTAPWFPREEAARFAVSALPFAVLGVSCLFEGTRKVPIPVAFFLAGLSVLWTVFCDVFNGSFALSSAIPAAALMIPKLLFDPTATFGTIQSLAVAFLVIGLVASLFVINRIYRDITGPREDALFAQPGRRIGIWVVVIVLADLAVSVAKWSHHQVLVPVQVGQHAFRVIPYTYNRFGQFKQVGLHLELGPGASRTLYLSPPHAISGIYLLTRVSSTRDIPWGTSVARISVRQSDRSEDVLLEFGEETVGDQYREAEKHFQGTARLQEWLDAEGRIKGGCSCRLDLPRPVIAGEVIVENLVTDATFHLEGLGFRPSPIRVVPLDRLRSRQVR